MVNYNSKFLDRKDAGKQLGSLLKENIHTKNTLVLGISPGGLEVAYEVAQLLQSDLSLLIAKKVRTMYDAQITTGAVSEEGQIFLPFIESSIKKEILKQLIEKETFEIEDDVFRYRNGNPLPDMKGRTVILVDDGICSKTTFVPAINLCRKRKAKKVIVAVPVGGLLYIKNIAELADETIAIKKPESFYAIGQVYEKFSCLNEYEINKILKNSLSMKRNKVLPQQMVATHSKNPIQNQHR